jgi:lysylphosphatidylglycerol synthetase-like protein (DUF2156 family)
MKQTIRKSATFVKYLFFITAIILAVFGTGSFMRVNAKPGMVIVYILYAVLMFGDAVAMLILGLYINRQMKPIYWAAVIILSLNIILTVFDQFGVIDLLFLLLNVVILVVLIVLRKELLPQ